MISIEEKMRVFSQYLINKERSWGKEIVEEAKTKRKELLEKSDDLIRREKKVIEEQSYRQIYREKNKIIAVGKTKAKSLQLAQKKLILEEFNDLILDRANEMVTGDLYEKYLSSSMDKVNTIFTKQKKLTIKANLSDMDLIKRLASEKLGHYTIDYQEISKDGFVRGMIVEDDMGRVQSDFSMKNTIGSNYKLIGMTLNGFMEKQVN